MSRTDARHKLQQRGRILQAAASLIASQGYHGMSMRGLAGATGISQANVYNYFASKEDILFALQKEAFETLLEATDVALADLPEPGARLYGLISHHVHYFAAHPDVMRILVYEAASLPEERRVVVRRLKEQYFEIGRGILRDLVEDGCGHPAARGRRAADPAELERITYGLFGMLNWIYGWYDPGIHGSPRELARTFHEIALCGMVADCPYRRFQNRAEAHLATVEPPPLLDLLSLPGSGGSST